MDRRCRDRSRRCDLVVLDAQVIFRFSSKNARTLAGVFFSWVAFLTLGGCAHFIPQTAELRNHWPADLPLQTEIADVPFFPQVEYQCGPAALATALVHAGVPLEPDELVSQVY